MKVEKLLELIGDIDDSFVEEATRGKRSLSQMPWGLMATAACLCLVIASVVFLRGAGLLPVAPIPTDPTGTTTQPSETTLPTETTVPSVRPSVEELFEESGSWHNIALTSTFTDPAEIYPSMLFCRTYDDKEIELTEFEQEALKDLLENAGAGKLMRFTAAQIDEVLLSCFGLTADQMRQDFWDSFTYLEETDCYYRLYWGSAGSWITVVNTEECDDGTVLMYYTTSRDAYSAPDRVARLQPHDTGYYILSNEYYVDNTGKTDGQIAMENLFGDLDSWYNRALACEYETPEQLSLIHVFYCGFPDESRDPTAEEWAQLKDIPTYNENYDLMRLPESKMNDVLMTYFGITLDDIPDEGFAGLTYLESTDCWYFMTTGWLGVDRFRALTVEELDSGTVRVCYDAGSQGVYVVTLQPKGDGYRILSNVKASQTANDLSTDWIVEEDTSITGEITFAIPFKGSQGMDAMIAAFNEIYPGIKINLYSYSTSTDSSVAINAAMIAGEVDVMASMGLTGTYKRWENGLFYDLTELVKQENIDLAEQWGTDAYTYDNRIYTFPCGGKSYYIAINMDAWNEAGLGELPTEWTWDEYLDASRKMTKLNADGSTVVYGGSDHHFIGYFMYTHCQVEGGDLYFDKDGTSSYDSPVVLAALEQKLKAELVDGIWYPQYLYRRDAVTTHRSFCQGAVASAVTFNITNFLSNTEEYPDVNWITGFAPYPTMEEGQENFMSGVTPYSHAGIMAFIEEEKLPAAWAFLKWYATYGSKYLVAAGHQPMWRGTDNSDLLPLIYGSEEEAAEWVDVESFKRVVGRVDLPFCAETTLTAYSDVSYALTEPIMQAINGEITAGECLKQALEEAEKAIKDAQ